MSEAAGVGYMGSERHPEDKMDDAPSNPPSSPLSPFMEQHRSDQGDLMNANEGHQRSTNSHADDKSLLSTQCSDDVAGAGSNSGVVQYHRETHGRSTNQKKTKRKKGKAPASAKVPGQSRYWTPEEHKRFLEALQLYNHKDLKAIANHVGTRNQTQVRTHTQKYFMKIVREAKRLPANPISSPPDGSREQLDVVDGDGVASSSHSPSGGRTNAGFHSADELRFVPEACGVTLLSLVAQPNF